MGQIARNAAGDRPGKMAMAGREPQHVTPKPTFGDLGVRRFVSMKCWKLEVIFFICEGRRHLVYIMIQQSSRNKKKMDQAEPGFSSFDVFQPSFLNCIIAS